VRARHEFARTRHAGKSAGIWRPRPSATPPAAAEIAAVEPLRALRRGAQKNQRRARYEDQNSRRSRLFEEENHYARTHGVRCHVAVHTHCFCQRGGQASLPAQPARWPAESLRTTVQRQIAGGDAAVSGVGKSRVVKAGKCSAFPFAPGRCRHSNRTDTGAGTQNCVEKVTSSRRVHPVRVALFLRGALLRCHVNPRRQERRKIIV